MRRSGPIITLVLGLVAGIIVLTLSVNAANNDDQEQATTAASATPSATASPAETTPPTPAPTTPPAAAPAPPADTEVTYAGKVDGGAATVAISVSGGQAVAYVCDGKQLESWLQGPATGGTLALTGADGSSLNGSYGNVSAAGSVSAGGKQWVFTAPVAPEPAGLYRATAMVAGARVVGGWIVLANGEQVGVTNIDGRRVPAPALDVASGQANLDGTPLTAELVGAEFIEAAGNVAESTP
jgi:serine/threonine-protein kinase